MVRRGLLPVRAIPDPCIPSRCPLCRVMGIQARRYSSQKSAQGLVLLTRQQCEVRAGQRIDCVVGGLECG